MFWKGLPDLQHSIQAKTEEELGIACLSVAIDVTGSQIGFIDEVDADGLLCDIAISDMDGLSAKCTTGPNTVVLQEISYCTAFMDALLTVE